MSKTSVILAGLAIGSAWMAYTHNTTDKPASVWSPMIDIPSFIFGGSLWFADGKWAPFVGGLIVGIHAVQFKNRNQSPL